MASFEKPPKSTPATNTCGERRFFGIFPYSLIFLLPGDVIILFLSPADHPWARWCWVGGSLEPRTFWFIAWCVDWGFIWFAFVHWVSFLVLRYRLTDLCDLTWVWPADRAPPSSPSSSSSSPQCGWQITRHQDISWVLEKDRGRTQTWELAFVVGSDHRYYYDDDDDGLDNHYITSGTFMVCRYSYPWLVDRKPPIQTISLLFGCQSFILYGIKTMYFSIQKTEKYCAAMC